MNSTEELRNLLHEYVFYCGEIWSRHNPDDEAYAEQMRRQIIELIDAVGVVSTALRRIKNDLEVGLSLNRERLPEALTQLNEIESFPTPAADSEGEWEVDWKRRILSGLSGQGALLFQYLANREAQFVAFELLADDACLFMDSDNIDRDIRRAVERLRDSLEALDESTTTIEINDHRVKLTR